jgi:hypothetical protein
MSGLPTIRSGPPHSENATSNAQSAHIAPSMEMPTLHCESGREICYLALLPGLLSLLYFFREPLAVYSNTSAPDAVDVPCVRYIHRGIAFNEQQISA